MVFTSGGHALSAQSSLNFMKIEFQHYFRQKNN